MTRSGYIAIIGLPNSGKSTLMNALLQQKISIITNKPQTTRKKILGILSEEDYQIIFLDTPGIIEPGYLLQQKMMEAVRSALKDADIIVLLVDVSTDPEGNNLLKQESVKELLEKTKKPVLLLLNKVDLSSQEKVVQLISKFENENRFKKVIPLSSSHSYNLALVLNSILEFLPENPKYYPDDIVAEENERFFVSEIIREKVFELYQEEIPYSTEVLIEDFKEREDKKDYVSAEIVVERESQKGIIIGKQGAAIKKLGQIARKDIEEFLQRPVFLELRVKVRSKWRSDEKFLKSFGYSKDSEE